MRIDSRADTEEDGKVKYANSRTFKPVLQPAGWAFAIWGAVYLAEFLFLLLLLLNASHQTTSVPSALAAPWCIAHAAQALWCFAFVPSLERHHLYLSAALLGAVAASLSDVHIHMLAAWDAAIGNPPALAPGEPSVLRWLLGNAPAASAKALATTLEAVTVAVGYFAVTAHYAWVTAATLVNVNSYLGTSVFRSQNTMVVLAALSALAALGLGAAHAVVCNSMLYLLVVAWTLTALTDTAPFTKLGCFYAGLGTFACVGCIGGAAAGLVNSNLEEILVPKAIAFAITFPAYRLMQRYGAFVSSVQEPSTAPEVCTRAHAPSQADSLCCGLPRQQQEGQHYASPANVLCCACTHGVASGVLQAGDEPNTHPHPPWPHEQSWLPSRSRARASRTLLLQLLQKFHKEVISMHIQCMAM